jgi:hypothetical protein
MYLRGSNDTRIVEKTNLKIEISSLEQFKFIVKKNNLITKSQSDFFGSELYYGLVVLPFLMLPLIVLFKRKKEVLMEDALGRIRRNNKLAKKYLSPKNKSKIKSLLCCLRKAMHNSESQTTYRNLEMSKDNKELLLDKKC